MNIISKIFGDNNNNVEARTVITETVENNKITIQEKTMENPNSFQKQRDLMRIFQNFYDKDEKEYIFQSCRQASAFSNAAIYLQECGQGRRVSIAEIVCFFQRSHEDLCEICFELVNESDAKQDHEFATDLLYFLSEQRFF